MKHDIEIIRGTTNLFAISITADGEPYVPVDGDKIMFGVKKRPHHTDCVLLKKESTVIEGVCYISLYPEDTIDLPCGKYFFDVGVESDGDFFNVIPCSAFIIKPNVTKKGDA